MRIGVVLNSLGRLLIVIGCFMFFPLFWSALYHEPDLPAFFVSAVVTIAAGLLLWRFVKAEEDIRSREGFAIVTCGWLLASFFGALPYLLSGTFDSFADAFFETMSGFTTTGASVLTNIEVLPHGILFWRSLTHWLGGMGIMVLFVALLSQLGVGGMQMFKAEAPGPVAEKLKPRIKETAKILWLTYLLMTVVETVLLWVAGMSLFDALAHTFGTLATGGFSTKNASIGFYQNPLIHWIIILFMFMAGANFGLYYMALKGKSLKTFWRNDEFKLYATIVCSASILVSFILWRTDPTKDIFLTITEAAFQVVSIVTTTGYATADFDQWPMVTRALIVVLMFVGGSAGSTGGSVKVGRILVLFKHSALELRRLIHPRAVLPLKISDKSVDEKIVVNILQFFVLYVIIFLSGWIIMAAMGLDLITALTSVSATLGNVGPGLNQVGPAANYAFIHPLGKYFLSFLMLLGRLEIYTVLVLLLPSTWRR